MPLDRRHTLKAQINMVADGGDSIGICFDPAKARVKFRSGSYYLASQQASSDRSP